MYILFIRNFKKKLVMLGLILSLWIVMFFLTNYFFNNNLIFNVTINNCISFSHPQTLHIDNIYVNERLASNSIETSAQAENPLTGNFSSYQSLTGKFSFSYPSAFTLNEQKFAGTEILYHIDFYNNTRVNRGFVQVWNLPYPLQEFLEKSKASSQQKFKNFKSSKITVNKLPGYFWDYLTLGNDGQYYKGSEVFLTKDGLMYRISYFVPEKAWNKNQSKLFWKIVYSFKAF